MRRLAIVQALLFLSFSVISQTLPEGFTIQEIASGMEFPTTMIQAEDGRIFIAEKGGRILVFENGELLEDPFYVVETETPGERGVTGLALHPDFDQNGWVYLHYNVPDEDINVLSRVQALGNSAIPESEEILFEMDPMWGAWHNGGGMVFDLDGKLILGTGDGLTNTVQDWDYSVGKIFRLNDDGSIPTDNPYYSTLEGKYRAIVSLGLRNPYSMDIDPVTGTIYFGDVGNSQWEEINEYQAEANYGYPMLEGYAQAGDELPEDYLDPIFVFDHDFGCAVVGLTYYPSTLDRFPEPYRDKLFFSNFCQGELHFLDPETGQSSPFGSGFQLSNELMVGNDGSLYVLEIYNGRLFKIDYNGTGEPFIISGPNDQTVGMTQAALFTVDANGPGDLEYQWYENGISLPGQTQEYLSFASVGFDQDGNTYTVTVSNENGSVESQSATLNVINGLPPTITLSAAQNTYSAGSLIQFEASAIDTEDGLIPESELFWNLEFHHNTHKHPVITDYAGGEMTHEVPRIGETAVDVFFRATVSCMDSDGLVSESSVDVFPELVDIEIDIPQPELYVIIEGKRVYDGEIVASLRGLRRTFTAPGYQISADQVYQFEEWSADSTLTSFSFLANDTIISPHYEALHEYICGEESEPDVLRRFYNGVGDSKELYYSDRVEDINEDWNVANPFHGNTQLQLPDDGYSIEYIGSILAPYTGTYEMYGYHDGQISLWIDDELVLTGSQPVNDRGESTGTVDLIAGKRYNFTLEYEHYEYISAVRLGWRFSIVDEVIPPKQLYPFVRDIGDVEDFLEGVIVSPNPSNAIMYINLNGFDEAWRVFGGELELMNILGERTTLKVAHGSSGMSIDMSALDPGLYLLSFDLLGERVVKKIVKN